MVLSFTDFGVVRFRKCADNICQKTYTVDWGKKNFGTFKKLFLKTTGQNSRLYVKIKIQRPKKVFIV